MAERKLDQDYLDSLGNRIKRLRLEQNMTQQTLSSKARLDRSYIANLELGKKNPSICTLLSIANALGIDIRELVKS